MLVLAGIEMIGHCYNDIFVQDAKVRYLPGVKTLWGKLSTFSSTVRTLQPLNTDYTS